MSHPWRFFRKSQYLNISNRCHGQIVEKNGTGKILEFYYMNEMIPGLNIEIILNRK